MTRASGLKRSNHFSEGTHKFWNSVAGRMKQYPSKNQKEPIIIGLDPNHLKSDNPNLIVYQVIAKLPFTMDAVFTTNNQRK